MQSSEAEPNLGMYVHMHWGYNHPYAARTWTIDDWRSYAGGLKALGYNMVMIWPMFETIPDPPTPSDIAHLEKIARVIDLLHSDFGMSVHITLGPNTIGNEKAAAYTFERRPFFETDLRLNPGDPAEVERLMRFRRTLYHYVGEADGASVIDSDPGGYIGSTNEEFIELLWRHLDLIQEFNPNARLFYWMWVGWEAYNRMWERAMAGAGLEINITRTDFEDVVGALAQHPERNWGVFSCSPLHQEVVEQFGIQDRALFFPYGLVEVEPTFPLTNHLPDAIRNEFRRYSPAAMRLGAMANSQTHVAQLPNAYYFAHFAKGGTLENANLEQFAEGLTPGMGALVADAWREIATTDSNRMRALSGELRDRPAPDVEGPYSGLLMGDPERFLSDLSVMLAWRADVVDFVAAADEGEDWRPALGALARSWRAWQERTGFVDAYCDTQSIHPALAKLGDPRIDSVLADFDNWRDPSVRHGIVPRLLDAMEAAE